MRNIGVSQVQKFLENLQDSMHRLATLGWLPGDRCRTVEGADELAARGN